jgi:hypothetical protein
MGSLYRTLRGRKARHPSDRGASRGGAALATAAALVLLAAATSCTRETPGSSGPGTVASAAPAPVSAEINQLRDNYSKKIIAIQLTNNTPGPLVVLGAEVASAWFEGPVSWQPPAGASNFRPVRQRSSPRS